MEVIQFVVPIAVLAALWTWESLQPFFSWDDHRLRHAVRNIGLTVFNKAVTALLFSAATVLVASWATTQSIGVLNLFSISWPLKLAAALLLLDGWMYVWHRANHMIPLLWLFHRMHHSDHRMDVTTATRFHLGELAMSSTLRLGLIPILGLEVLHIVIYDLLVAVFTRFHHANISLGRWDDWIRILIVTPNMHKVHHSRLQPETDSNYAVVLSVWDRLGRSFRFRKNPKEIEFGLDGFDEDQWQTFVGLLKTPFRRTTFDSNDPAVDESGKS